MAGRSMPLCILFLVPFVPPSIYSRGLIDLSRLISSRDTTSACTTTVCLSTCLSLSVGVVMCCCFWFPLSFIHHRRLSVCTYPLTPECDSDAEPVRPLCSFLPSHTPLYYFACVFPCRAGAVVRFCLVCPASVPVVWFGWSCRFGPLAGWLHRQYISSMLSCLSTYLQ